MKKFGPVFIASFFLSLHYGAILYVNSSLLGKFFQPNAVSLLFVVGAVGNILLFLYAAKLIEKFGKRLLLIIFFLLVLASTLSLALSTTGLVAAISFVIYISVIFMLFYCLDIFLEELSTDTKTGRIRGAYLTIINLGVALGPLVLSYLTPEDGLKNVYIAVALLLIVPLLFALFSLKSKAPKRHSFHHRALLPFKLWWQTRSLRRVTLAKLSLELFFALMFIYMPLYLHEILGFNWSVIGLMFTVMLLPFVLFQWPLGKLADHLFGEKEFMIVGFLIIGANLLYMPYLGVSIGAWTLILFLSRIGASFVEITTDSYFFKHVSPSDTGFLSIFRLTRSVSLILGAVVGVVTLNLFSFEKIFFILAIAIFFGLKESLSLRDTL